MLKAEIARGSNGRIILMDSITKVTPEDEGALVVSASHGGTSSGEFALAVPLKLVVFNDAGVGKDEAGVAALAMLESRRIACLTTSHTSGRIGDAEDMWHNGVISRANASATALGFAVGQDLKGAALGFVGASQTQD